MFSEKILLLAIWIVLAVATYFLIRLQCRKEGNWNNFNRLAAGAGSVFFAPYLFVIALVVVVVDRLSGSKWGKREVKW